MRWRVPVSHRYRSILLAFVLVLPGCIETTSSTPDLPWARDSIEASTLAGAVEPGSTAEAAQAAVPAAPLAPAPGRNITASTCSQAIERKVQELGAVHFEAASASSHNWTRDGTYFGRVRMRAVYPTANGPETRDAVIVCVVDARGRLRDVYTPAD
jgi:hypothetical protein